MITLCHLISLLLLPNKSQALLIPVMATTVLKHLASMKFYFPDAVLKFNSNSQIKTEFRHMAASSHRVGGEIARLILLELIQLPIFNASSEHTPYLKQVLYNCVKIVFQTLKKKSFFFFFGHPMAYGVPRPGIRFEPQLRQSQVP